MLYFLNCPAPVWFRKAAASQILVFLNPFSFSLNRTAQNLMGTVSLHLRRNKHQHRLSLLAAGPGLAGHFGLGVGHLDLFPGPTEV